MKSEKQEFFFPENIRSRELDLTPGDLVNMLYLMLTAAEKQLLCSPFLTVKESERLGGHMLRVI